MKHLPAAIYFLGYDKARSALEREVAAIGASIPGPVSVSSPRPQDATCFFVVGYAEVGISWMETLHLREVPSMRIRTAVILMVILLSVSVSAQSITGGGCTVQPFSFKFGFPFNVGLQYVVFTCPDTAWVVFFENTDRGLQVGPAALIRDRANAPSAGIWVIQAASIVENITIYHDGKTRLNDSEFSTADNAIPTLGASLVPPAGLLLTDVDQERATTVVELRERGLAWLCTWGGLQAKSISRRGMAMTLWGIYDTGNYDYIIEYTFRDDGQISFRVGATGWNNAKDVTTDTPHTHTFLWRIDSLLGSAVNSAWEWRHHETSLEAFDFEMPFNNGYEGAMDLDPAQFATVILEDQMQNDRHHNIGYALQPFGPGTARHYAADERWTLHDIYVTRSKAAENAPPFGHGPLSRPDSYLLGTKDNPSGIFDHETTQNQHLVLWHKTSAHHDPHDEDQAADDSTNDFKGITLIHWSGFDLVPHNLFNSNPLGGPHRQKCDGYP